MELSITKKRIIEMIREDRTVTADVMAASIGLTVRAIGKNIRQLKDAGIHERKNGDRGGYWKIIE
jgi:predicted DNA-binding transcriptional regulator YafY